jgi:hypothetical protein
MAVLDQDHHHLAENEHVSGGVGQFCLFWVGMFAVIGLISFLFKS